MIYLLIVVSYLLSAKPPGTSIQTPAPIVDLIGDKAMTGSLQDTLAMSC